jgi:hypothetical protein
MGGGAFPKLDVPRLATEEYTTIRDKCITILQDFYEQVSCPPEAPEKLDHGDVDLLVCGPKTKSISMDQVGSRLGAIQRTKAGVTTNFAVHHPSKPDAFSQIDIHVCQDGRLEWESWMGGYGDLVQIVGVLNRGIGLTMNDKGLHVRIPEIEPSNRKASMIRLTDDPINVMKFLGLDSEEYKRGFESQEQIFRWIAAARFYGPDPERSADDETTISKNSSNDRQRFRKRQMFAQFFNEWAPAHLEAFKNEERIPRQDVLREAIDFFQVQVQYNDAMSTWKLEETQRDILKAIRRVIPAEGEKLGQAIRGAKRWTAFQNGTPVMLDETDPNKVPDPHWLRELKADHKEVFLDWLKANWVELQRREKHRASSRN